MPNEESGTGKNQNGGAVEPPVVIVTKYRIEPGSLEEWETEIKKREEACLSFAGCDEFVVMRPPSGKKDGDKEPSPNNAEFQIVSRFRSGEAERKWDESDARKSSDAKIEKLLQGPVDRHILTGIETFHTANGTTTIVAPPRHKISLLNWLALFPLALTISYLTTLVFGEKLPLVLRTLLLSACLVPLTNYLVMPNMTRAFARWLYPSPKQ